MSESEQPVSLSAEATVYEAFNFKNKTKQDNKNKKSWHKLGLQKLLAKKRKQFFIYEISWSY